MKILDKIVDRLAKNNLPYIVSNKSIDYFLKIMSLHAGHNPIESRKVCINDVCRFLRNGKIYKCPIDALKFKFAEHFNIKDFPLETGIDIYAKNFNSLLEQLNGNIEFCSWCSEKNETTNWESKNKPELSDWIVDENKF